MWNIVVGGSFLGGLYFLVFRGAIFRAILWGFGWWGLSINLDRISFLQSSPMTIFSYFIHWSFIIGFVITLLAIITTKYSEKKNVQV